MTANKNEPDKKPAGSASAQTPSRPHATLDLKATEVTPPSGAKTEAAKAEPGKSEGVKFDKPEVAEASAKAQASASSASAPTSSAAAANRTGAAASKPGPTVGGPTPSAKDSKPAGTPPPLRPRPRGRHRAATAVSSPTLRLASPAAWWRCSPPTCSPSSSGFETADNPDKVTALEQRLAAIESNRNQRSIPPDVASRLAAAETKLGKLEQLDANIDGIAKKQGQLDEGLNAVKDKLGAETGDTADAGACRQAGRAAVAHVVGRRARSAKRPPAAARRHQRQAHRSRADDGQPARCAAQERHPRDRPTALLRHRGRPSGALGHAAHGPRAFHPEGRERRDVVRADRPQDRQRSRRGQPQDDAGGDQAPQGRSRLPSRHLRQARGCVLGCQSDQRQADGAAAGRAGRDQERGRSPHHRRAHRAVSGARQPEARHRPRQRLRPRAGAGAQSRRRQRRPSAARAVRARWCSDVDRAARAIQAGRLQDHRRRRAARRRLDRRPPARRRFLRGARAQDEPQP